MVVVIFTGLLSFFYGGEGDLFTHMCGEMGTRLECGVFT
jgi:hypothetical protein